ELRNPATQRCLPEIGRFESSPGSTTPDHRQHRLIEHLVEESPASLRGGGPYHRNTVWLLLHRDVQSQTFYGVPLVDIRWREQHVVFRRRQQLNRHGNRP